MYDFEVGALSGSLSTWTVVPSAWTTSRERMWAHIPPATLESHLSEAASSQLDMLWRPTGAPIAASSRSIL